MQVKVKEGERVRLQSFEGVVIAKRNRGLNSPLPYAKFLMVLVLNAYSKPTAH